MKIEYVKGDLFATNVKTIVHGCNAQGVMGSGVAKIVRERFPEAYGRYIQEGRNGHLMLGDIIPVPCGDRKNQPDNFKLIVNAITQEYYGSDGKRYVSYDAVANAMDKISKMSEIYGIKEIAMPMIGAGLGGGDWNVISAIIENTLDNTQVYVYYL